MPSVIEYTIARAKLLATISSLSLSLSLRPGVKVLEEVGEGEGEGEGEEERLLRPSRWPCRDWGCPCPG